MKPPRRFLAQYAEHDAALAALRRLREAGCVRLRAYLPFPSDEIDELLPEKRTPVGWIMFTGGALGGGGAYFMEWWAAHDFPYNVGGRPLDSWPAFVPVTFELTVLCASICGFIAVFALCRLPRLHHPVFEAPEFGRASQDRFFLAVMPGPPGPAEPRLRELLEATRPESITEVEG